MSNRKKITLAILVFLTALLAGVSIYVTIRLQESQAPTETGAATGPGFTNACGRGVGFSGQGSTCNAGCSGTNCSGTWVVRFSCNGNVTECGGGGAAPFAEASGGSMGVTGRCGTTDQIDVFSKNCRASGGWNCGGGDLKDYIVYYNGDCAPVTPKYRCSNNSCIRDDANGTYSGSNCDNACAPRKPICGEACNTDADCATPTNGGTAVCRDEGGGVKKCANAFCPQGKTIFGTRCDCSAGRTCGQTCNASVGLCGDGKSVCRYIVGPSCTTSRPNTADTTYCVPTTGAGAQQLTTAKCVSRDQGNSYVLLNGQNPTPAQIMDLCNLTLQTTCYKCTDVTNDGNTCTSQVVSSNSCPAGWTTNSVCSASAPGGACPVDAPKIKCYRCTGNVLDGNMCESQDFDGTSCPSGWTNNSNCAAAATGGSCPTETPTASATAACVSNSNQITINWNTITGNSNDASGYAYAVDISDNNLFNNRGTKFLPIGTNQTVAPTGFRSNGGDYTIDPTKVYYIRVAYLGLPNVFSNTVNLTTLTCTEPTISCYRCTGVATDGNMCENQQFNGTSCPSGWTNNSNCAAAAPGGSCPVQVACGASCNGSSTLCPQNHTCDGNVCKLNTCLTPGNCSDNTCTPTVPVCGSACTSNAQCPNDHSCMGNKCVLNGCTSSTCTNGCVPICGGPCTTNSDCPSDHSCSANKCVLNSCTPSTCTNGCTVITVIPQTALGDDARLLVIGTVLILIGYLSIKFGVGSRTNFLTNMYESLSANYEQKAERKLKQKAEK
jgi:hypothetical protein